MKGREGFSEDCCSLNHRKERGAGDMKEAIQARTDSKGIFGMKRMSQAFPRLYLMVGKMSE